MPYYLLPIIVSIVIISIVCYRVIEFRKIRLQLEKFCNIIDNVLQKNGVNDINFRSIKFLNYDEVLFRFEQKLNRLLRIKVPLSNTIIRFSFVRSLSYRLRNINMQLDRLLICDNTNRNEKTKQKYRYRELNNKKLLENIENKINRF